MAGGAARDTLRDVKSLFGHGVLGDLSDEQLLDRFVTAEEGLAEAAFALLMQRHGPMVFGVCKRVLNCRHEAEDAFQSTFLVLARKAGQIVRREGLSNWLYGVALRTAKDGRSRILRRRKRERHASELRLVHAPSEDCLEDVRALLDEELARLPARFRTPVLLCELQSLSRQEAARHLGIPEGTLSSRLARAKVLLRERLTRRGLCLTGSPLATAMAREAGASLMPQELVEPTIRAATCVAAGESGAGLVTASVLSLTDEVIRTMLVTKLKGLMFGVISLGVAVTGAAVLGQSFPQGTTSRTRSPSSSHASSGDTVVTRTVTPDVNPGSDTDRLRGVEQKLDRILEALGTPRNGRLSSDRFAREPAVAATASNPFERGPDMTPAPATTAPPFLAAARAGLTSAEVDRITTVERRLAEFERRLENLERHLKQDPIGGPTSSSANPQ
jgi:RNA polymerase sigma-70 factor (ECF subfamily)